MQNAGETLNKMARVPTSFAVGGSYGRWEEGAGKEMVFNTLHPGEVNNQITRQPLEGQATCLCGQNDLGIRSSKRKSLVTGHCFLHCNVL